MNDVNEPLADRLARDILRAFFGEDGTGLGKSYRFRRMVLNGEDGSGTLKDLILRHAEARHSESLCRQKARRFPPGVHLIGGQHAAETNRRAADEFYAKVIPVVVELRRAGKSLRQIGHELDRRGFKLRLGMPSSRWHPMQVRRVLARVRKVA